MEKFKINNLVKRELARKVKNLIKEQYEEIAIFYDCSEDVFFTAEPSKIEKLENEGYCFYGLFIHLENDKLTLSEIENKIFSPNFK